MKTVHFLSEMEGGDTAVPSNSGQGGVGDTSDRLLQILEESRDGAPSKRMKRKLADETLKEL